MAGHASSHDGLYEAVVVFTWIALAYCLVIFLIWTFRGRCVGSMTLDATPRRSRIHGWFLAGYLVLWLVAVVTDQMQHLFPFQLATMFMLVTVFVAGRVLEIRERGIVSDCWLVRWNQVKAWYWEDDGGTPMTQWSGKSAPKPATMRIELLRPLLFRRSIQVLVPYERVDDFTQAMRAHVQAGKS